MRLFVSIIILSISAIVVNAFVNEVECHLDGFISSREHKIPYQGHLLVVIKGKAVVSKRIGGRSCDFVDADKSDRINEHFEDKTFWIGLFDELDFKGDYIQPTKLKSTQTYLFANHL